VLPEKLAAFYAVSVHAADLEKDFATSLPRLGSGELEAATLAVNLNAPVATGRCGLCS